MVEIITPVDGKTRNVKDLEVKFYEQANLKGEVETVKGIQFTVVGNNREWEDWIPYNEFKKTNPHVEI
jgi:hypothetical protein